MVVFQVAAVASPASRELPGHGAEAEEPQRDAGPTPTVVLLPHDPPAIVRVSDPGPSLLQGLYKPRGQETAPVRPDREPWPRSLAREPGAPAQAPPPPSERQVLVDGLRAAGFRPIGTDGPAQRWRLADASALGYPGAVNVIVPPTFRRTAPAHVYLHGYMLDRGGSLERQVFGRRDQRAFSAMIAESGTRGLAIIPESPGQNDLFNSQWSDAPGVRRFDTFMRNMARTTIGADRFAAASLSTHSGSGLLGDRLVLDSAFGRDLVRFRGHFDDGFGTRDWMTRYRADRAIAGRGGTILALARTPSFEDHIGEGSNHMNAAAWFERTGEQPVFETVPYARGSDTHIRADQRLPTRPMSDFHGDTLPAQITRFNVTTRNHWEPINAWQTLLRMSNP